MASPGTIITERDYARFMAILERLGQEANAKLVFLLDKAGQQIASAGEMEGVDPTSLASLTAGNVAATEGVAQLVGETEFHSLYHEGRHENLHITVVGNRVILLIVFDERSSLGLVRLRVGQHVPALSEVVIEMGRPGPDGASPGFSEITEDDIDALFG